MTTLLTNFNILETLLTDGNTEFRRWVTLLSSAFTSVGLTKTSDTGQIDPATVPRPVNSFAGYEIRSFNDSAAATHPLVLKIQYGTASNYQRPAINIAIGTGSTGTGSLTGQFLSATASQPNTNTAAGFGQFAVCHADGVFWYMTRSGENVTFVHVTRTQATNGAWTENAAITTGAAGASTALSAVGTNVYCGNRATAASSYTSLDTELNNVIHMPWPTAKSGTGSGRLVSPLIVATPEMSMVDTLLGFRSGEFTHFRSFQAAPFPGVNRTYLALPVYSGSIYLAPVWE